MARRKESVVRSGQWRGFTKKEAERLKAKNVKEYKAELGWRASDPAHIRRAKAVYAQKGNIHYANASLQDLANNLTDPKAKRKAQSDAIYFANLVHRGRRR